MTIAHPDSSDALNKFEDLTGISPGIFDNPYDALIEASHNDPAQLQALYSRHRDTRNEQQRNHILSDEFKGPNIDGILHKLVNKAEYPDFIDPRHCLVFWARPPQHIKDVIAAVQKRLLAVAPNLWLMPADNLHMTALEITHSRTPDEIRALVDTLAASSSIPVITDYPSTHRARLIKPRLSYDAAALALSFVPAAGEGLIERPDPSTSSSTSTSFTHPPTATPTHTRSPTEDTDNYTYHHLRRDLYALSQKGGVAVESRYTVPSAHLTVARIVSTADLCTGTTTATGSSAPRPDKLKVQAWIHEIDAINRWLEEEYWPKSKTVIPRGGEWVVGEEKGLDCRIGSLWYGGGETVRLGKGF